MQRHNKHKSTGTSSGISLSPILNRGLLYNYSENENEVGSSDISSIDDSSQSDVEADRKKHKSRHHSISEESYNNHRNYSSHEKSNSRMTVGSKKSEPKNNEENYLQREKVSETEKIGDRIDHRDKRKLHR